MLMAIKIGSVVLMTNALCKMVTYHEEFLPITSHKPFLTWSSEITRPTKSIIIPLTQCLSAPNLVG